mmetsp:Transcript_13985/g.41160  ORF Transcript_13985/g.41160 Transcript_13985/m.41160 type:complete len:210 (-) Transcript_13985:468-1097(-)
MDHHLVRAGELEHHGGEELLRELHEVVVVRIGPVELTGGELRVVRHVDALVPKEPANLVDAVEAADHQHLEVELGGYPHVELAVQLVVVGLEGPRRGAAGHHVEDGRLHLDEGVKVEVAPQVVDRARAHEEDVARRPVHEEVQVALPVPKLLIREATLGEEVQARGEHLNLRGEERKLALLGLAREAACADNIAALDGRKVIRKVTRVG